MGLGRQRVMRVKLNEENTRYIEKMWERADIDREIVSEEKLVNWVISDFIAVLPIIQKLSDNFYLGFNNVFGTGLEGEAFEFAYSREGFLKNGVENKEEE